MPEFISSPPVEDPPNGLALPEELTQLRRHLVERVTFSFDIDGTLEFGDPPGPIMVETVRVLQSWQVTIGSASDRIVSDQRRLWESVGVAPDFVVVKNHLRLVAPEFLDVVHIGDRFADQLEAGNAGALFIHVDEIALESWNDLHQMASYVIEQIRVNNDKDPGEVMDK